MFLFIICGIVIVHSAISCIYRDKCLEWKTTSNSRVLRAFGNIHESIYERLHYSIFLRYMLENFMLLSVMTFLILFHYTDFSNWKLIINTSIALVMMALLLILPLLIFRFLRRNKDKLYDKDFANQYESLYENSKELSGLSFYYVVIFLVKFKILYLTLIYRCDDLSSLWRFRISICWFR